MKRIGVLLVLCSFVFRLAPVFAITTPEAIEAIKKLQKQKAEKTQKVVAYATGVHTTIIIPSVNIVYPKYLTADGLGNVYVAQDGSALVHKLVKISPNINSEKLIGEDLFGPKKDLPHAIAVDNENNLYVTTWSVKPNVTKNSIFKFNVNGAFESETIISEQGVVLNGIAFNKDNNIIYISTGTYVADMYEYDITNKSIKKTVYLGSTKSDYFAVCGKETVDQLCNNDETYFLPYKGGNSMAIFNNCGDIIKTIMQLPNVDKIYSLTMDKNGYLYGLAGNKIVKLDNQLNEIDLIKLDNVFDGGIAIDGNNIYVGKLGKGVYKVL